VCKLSVIFNRSEDSFLSAYKEECYYNQYGYCCKYKSVKDGWIQSEYLRLPHVCFIPKQLITQGLFRYVRNPGYIGAVFILVGEGIFLESAVVFVFAALMWVMFHMFVVYYEEPSLKEIFGESYEEYLKTVPKWIPRRQRTLIIPSGKAALPLRGESTAKVFRVAFDQ
jgi:steroid 5-alpha reductase family enzyme